jgi:hypothetical protein
VAPSRPVSCVETVSDIVVVRVSAKTQLPHLKLILLSLSGARFQLFGDTVSVDTVLSSPLELKGMFSV